MIPNMLSRAAAVLGVALALLAGSSRTVAAQEFKLVAHPGLAVDAIDAPTAQKVFLKQVAKAYPRRQLHLVVDNYATNLLKCRQEIRSAAMIFQAPIGFAPTPPVRLFGLTLCGLASRSAPPAGVAQERCALPKVGLPSSLIVAGLPRGSA